MIHVLTLIFIVHKLETELEVQHMLGKLSTVELYSWFVFLFYIQTHPGWYMIFLAKTRAQVEKVF